jgi:acyl carrier protein
MNRQEIFEKVKNLMERIWEIEKIDLTEKTEIANELGADSIDVVSLSIDIDKEFGIETTMDEMEGRWAELTVGDIVDLVESKLNKP